MTTQKTADDTFKLRLKIPEDLDNAKWLSDEIDRYTAAVAYVAYFAEARALMGDTDTSQTFEEFKGNVCRAMRRGYDDHGEQ